MQKILQCPPLIFSSSYTFLYYRPSVIKKKKKLCLFGMCGSHGLFHTSAAVRNSKLLCSVTCLVCFTLSSHLPMCDSSRLRKHKMWKKTEHMKTVVLRLHFLTDWNGTQVCCMKDIVL